jgi:hypothetical protein
MYRVTFATAPGDIGELYVSTSALTGTGATVTVGSEANPNSASPSSNGGFERDANQIGGTFTVQTSSGNITAPLPFAITKEDMRTALDGILGGSGMVNVTRNKPGATVGDNADAIGPAGGYLWTVQFNDDSVGGDVPMLMVNTSGLTAVGVNMVVSESIKGNELLGTFQVSSWSGSSDVTGEMLYHSTPAQMESHLESLGSI